MRAIQYLGSKLNVKDEISKIIQDVSNGRSIIVDAFAGTGIIGNELKNKYTIISNDIQKYSCMINKVLLSSNLMEVATAFSVKRDILENIYYKSNKEKLCNIFSEQLKKEQEIIDNSDLELLSFFTSSQLYYDGSNYRRGYNSEFDKTYNNVLSLFNKRNIDNLRKDPDVYMLFTLYYLNGYFSLSQCIQIDSVRFAIRKFKNEAVREYALFLLLHAVSEITCSVGKQFAQPIKLREKNLKLKETAAKRCLRDCKLNIFDKMTALHQRVLVNGMNGLYENIVYNLNINDLLTKLQYKSGLVYYLDPPYTIDHYSRFYHVLEVLIDYDYPELEKKKLQGVERVLNGRYPLGRFQSPLSVPSKAKNEFNKIFQRIAESKSTIVLSYSDAVDAGRSRVVSKNELLSLLNKHFKTVDVYEINHEYRKLNKDELNVTEKFTRELVFVGENYG